MTEGPSVDRALAVHRGSQPPAHVPILTAEVTVRFVDNDEERERQIESVSERRQRELDAHIARIVDDAPALGPRERDRLRELLRPILGADNG